MASLRWVSCETVIEHAKHVHHIYCHHLNASPYLYPVLHKSGPLAPVHGSHPPVCIGTTHRCIMPLPFTLSPCACCLLEPTDLIHQTTFIKPPYVLTNVSYQLHCKTDSIHPLLCSVSLYPAASAVLCVHHLSRPCTLARENTIKLHVGAFLYLWLEKTQPVMYGMSIGIWYLLSSRRSSILRTRWSLLFWFWG